MGLYSSIEVSATGLSAERLAMDTIANNIANANTTRTPEGGPFKRQLVVFAQKNEPADPADPSSAASDPASSRAGVDVVGIVNDTSPDRLVYDPSHPDADAQGYVHMPNVEVVKEMVDMMAASRAYDANVTAIQEVAPDRQRDTGTAQSLMDYGSTIAKVLPGTFVPDMGAAVRADETPTVDPDPRRRRGPGEFVQGYGEVAALGRERQDQRLGARDARSRRRQDERSAKGRDVGRGSRTGDEPHHGDALEAARRVYRNLPNDRVGFAALRARSPA